MSAEIFDGFDFLWKLVERDMGRYLKGDLDMEKANVGRAIGFGLVDQIEPIRGAWAEARRVRAERQQHAEGA